MITVETAVAYVRQIEAEWEGFAPTIIVRTQPDMNHEAYRVVTNNGDWTVWVQPDGNVYGEC